MDSIQPISLGSVEANKLDKSGKIMNSLESYQDGMKRTGVVNTRDLVNDLRSDIADLKHMVSDIVSGLSSVAQPAVLKYSEDFHVQLNESIQRVRCNLDNFCQKIDYSFHELINKQAELNKSISIFHQDSLDRQEKRIQRIEEMITQLRDEARKQGK